MTGPAAGSRPSRRLRRLAIALGAAALALAALLAMRLWVATPFHIATSSMEPALLGDGDGREGDVILVNRLAYLGTGPARWDIVAFDPIEAAPVAGAGDEPRREVDSIVKRVVGLPGEFIEIRGGEVLVDGRAVEKPPALAGVRYEARGRYGAVPVLLGPDAYFVLGDNSYLSEDSRRFGPVPRSAIFGRADWIVWPWSRAGRAR